MKKKLAIFLAIIAVAMFALGGCGSTQTETTDTTTPVEEPPSAPSTGSGKDSGNGGGKVVDSEPKDVITEDDADVNPGNNGATTGNEDGSSEGFKRIHFAFDKSALSSEAISKLDENLAVLNANPEMRIQISGHCDERGTDEYNLALGKRRAEAAKEYLVNNGISASRIDTISYGENRPLVEGTTEEAYAKNRRAEFVVM